MNLSLKRTKFICLLCLFLLNLWAAAQANLSVETLEIELQQISIEQGLSQGMINSMVEDREGYLWIATKDGLNRYDGSEVKVFRHQSDNPNSISENFIYSLCLDLKGRLWIGTQSRGVNLYLPESESFIRFNTEAESAHRLSSNFIGDLVCSPEGEMMVETLDDSAFNVIREVPSINISEPLFEVSGILDHFPRMRFLVRQNRWTKYLDFDTHGNIWYCDGDSLYRFNRKDKHLPGASQTLVYRIRERMSDSETEFMVLDNEKNNLFINDGNQELKRYNHDDQCFDVIFKLPDPFKLNKQQFIDSDQKLWLSQSDRSILSVNLKTFEITQLQPNWQKLEQGAKNHRGISVKDRFGNYWLGTGGNGVLKIGAFHQLFKPIPRNAPTRDHDIRLYKTVGLGGSPEFDKRTLDLWFRCREKLNLEAAGYAMSDLNSCLAMDKKGFFYYSAIKKDGSAQAMLKIDSKSGLFEVMYQKPSSESIWFGNPLFFDLDGGLWFGEKYSGDQVNLYAVSESGSINRVPFPVEVKKHQYRFISDVIEDSNKTFWLGTTQGLFAFNRVDKKWKHFENNANKGLRTDEIVLSLCEDPVEPQKYLWIGTNGDGMLKFNKLNGTVEQKVGIEILPNLVVYGILADEAKNLWISTNRGLTWFSSVTQDHQVFTTEHGLPGNEFNRYEYSKTKEGEMYFGGTGGVVHFNPKSFMNRKSSSEVRINSIALINKPLQYPDDRKILNKPIELADNIVLKHDFSMLSLGFTTMDLTAPNADHFQYKLEGLNDEWIDAGRSNQATYTNLDPGNYTFMVRGCNSANTWSTQPRVLQISVLAPWWETWWFRTAGAILVLIALYALYRYQLNQKLKIEIMRNNIARDLHDDIGSTLSSVSIYAAVLKQKEQSLNPGSDQILDKIVTNTSEMIESMNDIVWTIKSENDSFNEVVNRMRSFAVNMTSPKEIILHFNIADNVSALKFDMDVRKNIYLIFKEAVNNAIKYSQCKNLTISGNLKEGKLVLVIEDDGVGFDQLESKSSEFKLGGNGLKSMLFRASQVNAQLEVVSQPGKGTQVTLMR